MLPTGRFPPVSTVLDASRSIISPNPGHGPHPYSHFTDGKTKAICRYRTLQGCSRGKWWSWGSDPGLAGKARLRTQEAACTPRPAA